MENRDLFKNAIEDAKVSEADEIFPLYELADGENILLTWSNFPEVFPVGEYYSAKREYQLWCISLEELKLWYKVNSDDVSNWQQRLEQLLGLPANRGYTHFTAFTVFPHDVIRPAYQPDPQQQITEEMFDGSLLGKYEEWFRDNEIWSYRESEWPWTRLGYTYDWAEGRERGLCEFLILPGAEVKVEWSLTTDKLIELLEED